MQTLEDKISIVNRYIRNGIKTGGIPLPEALTLDTAWRGIQRELKQLEQDPNITRIHTLNNASLFDTK